MLDRVETVDNQECSYVHDSSTDLETCGRPAVAAVEEPDRGHPCFACVDCAEGLRRDLERDPIPGYRIRSILPSDLVHSRHEAIFGGQVTNHWCICIAGARGLWCRVTDCDSETCTGQCAACTAGDHSGHLHTGS